jgi:hypothetical protein
VVNAILPYLDGTSATCGNVVIFQTGNGELFLSISGFSDTNIPAPRQIEFQSISTNSVTSTNHSALLLNNFQSFACFVEDTKLVTPDGSHPIETLKASDLAGT